MARRGGLGPVAVPLSLLKAVDRMITWSWMDISGSSHERACTSRASAMTFDGVLTLSVPALAPKRFTSDGIRRHGGSSISAFRPAFLWTLLVAAACIATTAMQGKSRSRIIGPHFGLGWLGRHDRSLPTTNMQY